MSEIKDKVWFLREGLFAKYVIALVGLVVFVLAVNGAMEIWISYRGIKTSLTDAMSEKAEATAKRIQQSMSDLERQISWVTRASSGFKIEDRRADYTQLLRQVPQVSQLSLLSARGFEQLRVNRQTVIEGSNVDFARDLRFTETATRGTAYAVPSFRDGQPVTSISLSHSDGQVTVAEIDLRFLAGFPRRYRDRPGGLCLCRRQQGPGAGEFGQGARRRQGSLRAAAGRRHQRLAVEQGTRRCRPRRADDGECGAAARLVRVLRAADGAGADPDPRSIGADRASDRARPRGRDHRRHHHGPPHAGADHGTSRRRAAARRRRFRPSY